MNRTASLPAGSEGLHGLRLVAKAAPAGAFDLPLGFPPELYRRPAPPSRTLPLRRPSAPPPRTASIVSLPGTLLWSALLAITLLGALGQFAALPDASDRLDAFPESGYGFASEEAGFDEADRSVFGEARVLKRHYQVGHQQGQEDILLRVVDFSRARHAVLDPVFLFEGTGWLITEERNVPIAGGEARHLKMRRNGQTSEAMLWYSNLRTRHASSPREWWQSAVRRLTFGTTGPASVLVIVQSPSSHRPLPWEDLFDRFPALLEL